jgi:sialic acid synthase SpsE
MMAGQVILPDDLTLKRPGTGIAPSNLEAIIGKKIRVNRNEGHQLTWLDLE